MKKLFALFLVLAMLLSLSAAAMADDDADTNPKTLSWITARRAIEASELSGDFYQVGDLDVDIWVPDLLIAQEDIPEDCYLIFEDESGSVSVTVYAVELEDKDMDIEELEDFITDLGSVSDGIYWINGFTTLVYETKESDSISVDILSTDGYVLEFTFEGVSNPDFYSLASMVMSTIQRHGLSVEDVALMMDADLNNTWGPDKDVSYARDGSSITVSLWQEGLTADKMENINNWDEVREHKIDTYNLYVRVLDDFNMSDTLLTLQFTDDANELSFLTIESGEFAYDAFAA